MSLPFCHVAGGETADESKAPDEDGADDDAQPEDLDHEEDRNATEEQDHGLRQRLGSAREATVLFPVPDDRTESAAVAQPVVPSFGGLRETACGQQ